LIITVEAEQRFATVGRKTNNQQTFNKVEYKQNSPARAAAKSIRDGHSFTPLKAELEMPYRYLGVKEGGCSKLIKKAFIANKFNCHHPD